MITQPLQDAIDNLEIQDVYLNTIESRCINSFNPKYYDFESNKNVSVELKHFVKESRVFLNQDQEKILQVKVDLGVRWTESDDVNQEDSSEGGLDNELSDQKTIILALIEGSFFAEYLVKKELTKEGVDEFSLKNVSYHVWPYWRELVATQCDRLRLPRIMLPIKQFASNRFATEVHEDSKEDN